MRISVPVFSDDELLLDAGGRAAVGRGAVGLEREDHALLELDRALERVQPRDHRRLVEADAEAVAELEAEAGSPRRGSRAPRAVGQTAAISSVVVPGRTSSIAASSHSRHCLYASSCDWESAADVERAVVAGAVAHERVDHVEEGLVARAQKPVGEDVGVRVAAVAGDGVDRLDLLRAQLEEEVLAARATISCSDTPGREQTVDLLVDRVDDRRTRGRARRSPRRS